MAEQTLEGFRLSPQQERLWALGAGDPASPWRAVAVVTVDGDFDPETLAAALARVAERFEILRTGFQRLSGLAMPLQVVGAEAPRIERRDLSELSPAEREAELARIDRAARAAELGLADGSPLRVFLVRLGAREGRIVLALPALCADDAGLEVLVAELGRDGSTASTGEGEDLQYIDLAEWQHDLLQSEETAEGRRYWQSQERSIPTVGLAEERDADAAAFRPETVAAPLGGTLASRLERAGLDRTDLEVFLLACWQTLLWRLTGEPEIVVGRLVDGRKFDELERDPGPFARVLPVRGALRRGLPVRELARQIGWVIREQHRWQEYFTWPPAAGDEPSYLPWGFAFFDRPEAHRVAGMTLRLARREAVVDRFRLQLRWTGLDEIELAYDAARIDRDDAERLLERFLETVTSALDDPAAAVDRVRIVGAAERRFLRQLNAARRELGPEPLLDRLVAAQAEKTPERVAVETGEASLSYGALDARAEALARWLRHRGVGPETRVAVCMERSVDLLASLLGILKTGAAYLPLDPGYPGGRLGFMLRDAAPALVLTHRGLLAAADALPAPVFRLEELELEPAAATRSRARDASSLAYVIYTSGSTGRPKGVMVPHRAICNRLLWMRHAFPDAAGSSVLHKTPISFDASIWELFLALMAGGRVVMAPPGIEGDAEALTRAIERHRIGVLQLVPSMLPSFLDATETTPVAAMRHLFCGGEALPAETARRVLDRLDVALTNLYGPTECAIDVSAHPVDRDQDGAVVPLGQALANVAVHVLDERLRPVPLGVAGEIHAGGLAPARGYLGRPALTAERFLPDPLGDQPGGRLYRTGDLGRRRTDGVLEFLGRRDHQVKLRGYRIELGEIEARLRRHPQVRDAAVVVHGTTPERLLAYVVARDQDLGAENLRGHLEADLPAYMVPAGFLTLDRFPRTPSGKLDRAELARRPVPVLAERTDGAAPRTPTEEILAAEWAEILGVERLGVHEDVLALGWHSLMATRLASRLRRVFDVRISLRSFFDAPTVAALALKIDAALRGEPGDGAPPVTRVDRARPLPLSFAQQRLWFLHRLEPDSPFYNIPMALRFRGRLDVAALGQGLSEVARRHEALRTTFAERDHQPVQVIAPPAPVPLPVIDLGDLSPADRDAEAERLAAAESARPFDLERGPLLRALLVRLDEDEHFGILTLHHIISDGWSTAILTRELSTLYQARVEGRRAPLPELEIQTADFAAWQRDWLRGEVLETQISYWRRQLADAPAFLELPTDRPRPVEQTFRGATRARELPAELRPKLRDLGRDQGATLFMVLCAAGQALLGWYSGQDDVVVGTDVANRNRGETEGLIGFFINQLPLRVRLDESLDFRGLLSRVREVTLGAYAHQDLPFDKLVEVLNPERSLNRPPIFQVKINLGNVPQPELELPGLTIEPVAPPRTTAQFDWILNLIESPEGLAAWVEYNTDLFDAATIDRMLGNFQTLLEAVAETPELRVGEWHERLEESESRQRRAQAEARKGSLRDRLRSARRQAAPIVETPVAAAEEVAR